MEREMTKAELIAALEPFPDDTEMWMEADAGYADVGGVDAEPGGDVGVAVIFPKP